MFCLFFWLHTHTFANFIESPDCFFINTTYAWDMEPKGGISVGCYWFCRGSRQRLAIPIYLLSKRWWRFFNSLLHYVSFFYRSSELLSFKSKVKFFEGYFLVASLYFTWNSLWANFIDVDVWAFGNEFVPHLKVSDLIIYSQFFTKKIKIMIDCVSMTIYSVIYQLNSSVWHFVTFFSSFMIW